MTKKISNIIHNNLGHILTTAKNNSFKNGLYNLKNSSNFYAKCGTVDTLSGVSKAFNKYIYGNPIPREIEKIGASKKNFYAKDFNTELDWFILAARKYQSEINLFLFYKKEFENHFLIGNYEGADTTLNS